MNKYRELAKLFGHMTETVEKIADIEDVKIMFGGDEKSDKREKELMGEFKRTFAKINDKED